jgi:hypothetical protein
MATTFQLKEGATTTDLNDASNTFLSQYTPKVADIGDDTVTETAVIVIDDASAAELDSIRQGIIRRLYNAHARQTNRERDRTYIHFQPDGAAAEYRSEILDGRIANEKNAHGERWGDSAVEFSIIWTRRNFWEGPETQVPLTNTNGTDNTAGLNVYNCNDGVGASPNDRVNYIDIDSGDVGGELPAACRIEMVNPLNNLAMVWIGHNHTTPATFVWNYEAEDATSTGTTKADAAASDADYEELDITSGVGSWQDMLTWTITAAALDAAKGQMVKGVIRFLSGGTYVGNITSVWFRLRIELDGNPLFYTGRVKPDVAYATVIRDLFTFNLPPWLRGETGHIALDLTLEAYQATGATKQIEVDTMYLFPADGWRFINTNNIVTDTERLVDDGFKDLVYIDDTAGDDKHSICVAYGAPIMLEPGKDQRLYFLMHTTTANTSSILRYLTVKLYYRPRRYTI